MPKAPFMFPLLPFLRPKKSKVPDEKGILGNKSQGNSVCRYLRHGKHTGYKCIMEGEHGNTIILLDYYVSWRSTFLGNLPGSKNVMAL